MSGKRILLYLVGLALAGGLFFLVLRRGDDHGRGETTDDGPDEQARSGGEEQLSDYLRQQRARRGADVPVGGTVRDADSRQPLAGVTLTFRTTTLETAVVTVEKGTYQLQLPAATYEVKLTAEDHVATLPWPRVRLEPGSPITALDFALHRTATVAGRVVDRGLRPVGGAAVIVQRARGTHRFDGGSTRATTDAQGRFTLRVPPAEVLLRADAVPLGSALSRPLYARAGSHLSGVEIVVGGGASLSGQVIGPGRRAVGKGARVLLKDELGLRTVPCDAEGSFAVGGLAAGAKQLQATAPGFAPGQLTQITLAADASLKVVLEVGQGQGLAGRVVNEKDLPVSGARVSARPGSPGTRLLQLASPLEVLTDGEGAFRFTDLPHLPLEVTARGPGNSIATRNGIPPGTRDLVLRLQPTGTITGQVTDGASGKPVTDFTVTLVESSIGRIAEESAALRVVSASGRFTVEDLLPGSYGLSFQAPPLAPALKSGIAVSAGYSAQVAVVLDAGGTIEGIAVDRRGVGIPGAAVKLDSLWFGEGVTTEAQGKFLLPAVPRGRRSLTVTHPGYDTRVESGVSVFAGGTAQVRVELRERAGQAAGLSLSGIGAVIQSKQGQLVLIKAMPGSPAGVAGLRAGDVILAIDGAPAGGMSFADGIEALRGISGTPVRLKIKRGDQTFEVDILRGEVSIPGKS